MKKFALFTAVVLSMTSANSFAYLDPGTGSILIQGVIAAIAIAGFTLKSYWYRLRAMFSGKKQESKSPCIDASKKGDDTNDS